MAILQEPFPETQPLPLDAGKPAAMSIQLFSARLKTSWVLIALVICAVELVSLPVIAGPLLFPYDGMKIVFHIALGFISPLAFYSLNGISLCLLFSYLSGSAIEILQGLFRNGHSFHWYELAAKFALIALGFALAMERRYERRIAAGPLDIRLQASDL